MQLLLGEGEARDFQILLQPALVVALRDDGDIPLGGPPQENLRGCLAVLIGDALHSWVVEEQGRVLGLLHIELVVRLGAERTVGGDGHALPLCELDKTLLAEVGVVLDLQSGRCDFGVTEEVEDQLAVEVADTDAFRHAFANEFLHGLPCLLDGSVTGHDVLPIISESWWVAILGVDVFEGDGKVHDVQVEIVDAPILELLLADGLDTLLVVEGVPEFRNKEELFTLD